MKRQVKVQDRLAELVEGMRAPAGAPLPDCEECWGTGRIIGMGLRAHEALVREERSSFRHLPPHVTHPPAGHSFSGIPIKVKPSYPDTSVIATECPCVERNRDLGLIRPPGEGA